MVLKFNGTGFHCKSVVELSQTEFIQSQLKAGFKAELDANTRFLLLKEAYELCQKKMGIEIKPPVKKQTKPEDKED